MQLFKIDKKILSWALYDWANSAFSVTISSGFFPIFFKQYWSQGTDPTLTTARLGTTISISSLIIALLSPTLGALADQKGYKKIFCFGFMLLGILGSASMNWIPQGDWFIAATAYGIAMMGFNASSVFYDSLLPSVAPGKLADKASSLGFSLGYLGGGLIFLVNVLMYKNPSWFGLADGVQAIQVSFLSVAVWWGVFSIPLFKNVKEPHTVKNSDGLFLSTHKSVLALWVTFKQLLKEKNTLYFLIAFWLYIDGVYTVITMAVDYGISIGLHSSDLITALLVVQFIGFPFALLFGHLAGRWGCRIPILACILIYSTIVVLATHMSNAAHFFALAVAIGMVQGGVQALSRSLFSRMIPPNASGEYFGLFNLVGKFASILGPIIVGWGAYLSGNPRQGMLGLLVLFMLGGILLFKVKEPEVSAS